MTRLRNPLTPPPMDDSWAEWLRYMAHSLPPDAGELPYIVSMWSYALYNDGLTDKQIKSITPYEEEARLWLERTRRADMIQDSHNIVPFGRDGAGDE